MGILSIIVDIMGLVVKVFEFLFKKDPNHKKLRYLLGIVFLLVILGILLAVGTTLCTKYGASRKEPTPTPTHTPTPTTPPLPPLRDIPVSIVTLANDDVRNILPDFPVGDQTLGGVRFSIPDLQNKASSQCEDRPGWPVKFTDWPTEFEVSLNNIQNPETIYILINAGYSAGHVGKQVGTIQVNFADKSSHLYDLIVGRNIRDWNYESEPAVKTISNPDLVEVYHGLTCDGRVGVVDMLALNIPEAYRHGSLLSMTIRDTSLETTSSVSPCFFFIGVTVSARD